nr:thymidylate kinase [uncultured bacterium]
MSLFNRAPKERPKPGKLIVIDGTTRNAIDVQTELLLDTLTEAGYRATHITFPRHTEASSPLLQKYLPTGDEQMEPHAAALLYAMDRFDAIKEMRELLKNGTMVITNYYVSATAGYQGTKIRSDAERVKFYRWLDQIEYAYFGIPRPDLTVILRTPAELAVEQKLSREQEYSMATERAFLEIATLFPNTKLVDYGRAEASLSSQQVHAKIWELVRRIILKGLPPTSIAPRR